MTVPALLPSDPHLSHACDPAPVFHGVLPWRQARKTGLRILLVKSEDDALWSVPLGAPVEGRAPFLSAALHAFEDAGVIGDIETSPLIDYCRGDAPGGRVILHAMRVRGTLSHWKRRNRRLRQWFAPAEAAERLHDGRLAGLIRALGAEPQMLDRLTSGAAAAASR